MDTERHTEQRDVISSQPWLGYQSPFTINKQQNEFICSYSVISFHVSLLFDRLWWWWWVTNVSTRGVYSYRKRLIEVKKDEEWRQKLLAEDANVCRLPAGLLHLRDVMMEITVGFAKLPINISFPIIYDVIMVKSHITPWYKCQHLPLLLLLLLVLVVVVVVLLLLSFYLKIAKKLFLNNT